VKPWFFVVHPSRLLVPVAASSVDLPRSPGVYLFKTADGRVLYVGKATDLRSRVRSYFSSNPDRQMIPELIKSADDVSFIVTNNPSEALVLERQLIREHKPRYNSMLKDDKSFPFLVLTDEDVPRIMYTRNPPSQSRRWGPFPDAGAAKRMVQLLRRQFGIRDCKELLPQGCLSMHIGLCAAPCIDTSGYQAKVDASAKVLDGQAKELLEVLVDEMKESSETMRYEEAATVRDLIAAVRKTQSQQVISSRFYRDCDAIGFASRGDLSMIVVLHAKEGIVQSKESWALVHRGDIGQTVARFVSEHYADRMPPALILSPTPMVDSVSAWLQERRGSSVEVRVPHRGDLATLRKLADQNAEVQIDKRSTRQSGSLEQRSADDGAALLGLERLDHIACFDMAQLQGDEKVGACVVLRNGRPSKKEYRTYIVKQDVKDDLRMMTEVVERWLKRQEEWPDLLLLDGGQTHLSYIDSMLQEHGVGDRFHLAALAKREETLHRRGADPIILDRMGRVIVHARDEAHRFVNSYHRKRRSKRSLKDPLEEIEGLGAKKLQALIRYFGGRKEIVHASSAQLQQVPGIGPALAERIRQHLSHEL